MYTASIFFCVFASKVKNVYFYFRHQVSSVCNGFFLAPMKFFAFSNKNNDEPSTAVLSRSCIVDSPHSGPVPLHRLRECTDARRTLLLTEHI